MRELGRRAESAGLLIEPVARGADGLAGLAGQQRAADRHAVRAGVAAAGHLVGPLPVDFHGRVQRWRLLDQAGVMTPDKALSLYHGAADEVAQPVPERVVRRVRARVDDLGARVTQISLFSAMAQKAGGGMEDKTVRRLEGIINSMTLKERAKPEIKMLLIK